MFYLRGNKRRPILDPLWHLLVAVFVYDTCTIPHYSIVWLLTLLRFTILGNPLPGISLGSPYCLFHPFDSFKVVTSLGIFGGKICR